MKCPSCNNAPMSKLRFFFFSNPFKSECQSCGVLLKPNRILKKLQLIELVIAITAGFVFAILYGDETLGVELLAGLVTIAAIVVLLLPLEMLSWEKGGYDVVEDVEE